MPVLVYTLEPTTILSPSQILCWFTNKTGWLIVKFNVATLSHPTEFVPDHVYVPDDV